MRTVVLVLVVLVLAGCSPSPGQPLAGSVPASVQAAASSSADVPSTPSSGDGSTRPPTDSGFFDRRTTFDLSAVQPAVRKILTDPIPDGFGLEQVSPVLCPEGMVVEPGLVHVCTVSIADVPKIVELTVVDEHGLYEVGFPKDPPPGHEPLVEG